MTLAFSLSLVVLHSIVYYVYLGPLL